jgi:hypothetical protein
MVDKNNSALGTVDDQNSMVDKNNKTPSRNNNMQESLNKQ